LNDQTLIPHFIINRSRSPAAEGAARKAPVGAKTSCFPAVAERPNPPRRTVPPGRLQTRGPGDYLFSVAGPKISPRSRFLTFSADG